MPAGTPPAAQTEPLTAEYALIKQNTPQWLIKAAAPTREAFKSASTQPLEWLVSLPDDQRQQLKRYNEASAESQNALDQAMAPLQTVEAFAKPILAERLKKTFNIELDLDTTWLHLRKPIALGALEIKIGEYSVLKLTLLQAALHNFEERECVEGAFDSSSGLRVGDADNSAAVTSSMSVERLLRFCRAVDIGDLYQRHLKAFFDSNEATLRPLVIRAEKDALQAAAYLALLQQDIGPGDYAVIEAVLAGHRDVQQGGKPVWFSDLSIMGLRLSGCTVFVPVDKYQYSSEVLVYLPHDPVHPLKKYPNSHALEGELTRQLMAADSKGPGRYPRYFAQFLAYADQPVFYSRLTQEGSTTKAQILSTVGSAINQYVLPFVSATVSILLAPKALPPKSPAPREPIKDPNFYIRVISKRGLWEENVALWEHNADRLRDKLIADARQHAVPTADVDARARARKIAALEQAGLFGLNLVSMFVPVLGEVMLGVMAGQLLYETFDGAIEWSEGDREAAVGHITDVAENLAQMALMAGGGAVLGRVLRPPPVIENLKPVTLPSGEQKLWKNDLTPYKANVELPPDARPDELGLYHHEGQALLPLEGEHYAVQHDPHNGEYRIQHPTRPDAYAPGLEHNQEGAWHHEGEAPLTWDDATVRRRLGYSSDAVQLAQVSSGIDTDVLRAAHVDHESVPLLLADSLQRIAIHREMTGFIEQLASAEPAVYAKADVALQMHLMQRRGLLSGAPKLRVMDRAGKVLWDDPTASTLKRHVVVLSPTHLARGEALDQLLFSLEGYPDVLKEMPGSSADALASRAGKLRSYLAQSAETIKAALVEERYTARTRSADPDVQRLLAEHRSLPSAIASRVLERLSPEERQLFRDSERLPEPLAEQVRWYEQETRAARAYEGVLLGTPSDLDSQRLALRTLETLPGWRRGTRVELRYHSAQGKVLDAIGSPDHGAARSLVLDEHGDFYTAAWQLLSASERQNLGIADSAQLKAAIQRKPLPRAALRTVLLDNPIRKPAYDPSLRLLGGGRGLQQLVTSTTNVFRTPEARVRRLYPTFGDADVGAFIQNLGPDVRGSLSRLESEYASLEHDLKSWVRTHAPQMTATAFDRRGGYVGNLANQIKRCWRRETGRSLHISGSEGLPLPALSADFSHVDELELTRIAWAPSGQRFLANFPRLKHLRMAEASLNELPESITAMGDLTHLWLRSNNVCLTVESAQRLAGMRALETLDLSGNPLGITPDVSGMPHLKNLDLSHTSITQWPRGLRDQAALQRLDLSHNWLRNIPPEHLNPPAEDLERIARINGVTVMLGNPFSLETAAELDQYWRRLKRREPALPDSGIDDAFAIETPQIAQVRRMYPHYSIAQARDYIWALGEDAAQQLQQREVEFIGLNQQLNGWAFSGTNENARAPNTYVRAYQRRLNADVQIDRFEAKSRILNCWRRATAQKLASDGTPIGLELDLSGLNLPALPELEADFGHVGSLKLNNMNLTVSPEQFLSRFRGVRWLDLSNNRLRELPPALGEMHGLTRLFLQKNLIRLTPESAQILAQRTTLRALWMDNNPLGLTPDFSLITDMRSLSLDATGIDTWPTGLGAQPALDKINLRSNRLTNIPDSVIAPPDDQLAQSARLNNITNVTDNAFTAETLARVNTYSERLHEAGITQGSDINLLVMTARTSGASFRMAPTVDARIQRWTRGLSAEQIAARQQQWLALREQEGSDGFFQMLDDLIRPEGDGDELQQRVWEVIDTITENTAESHALRQEMFDWAGRAACCDRAALSFSNLEIRAMVYRARALATDETQGAALIKLSRGLLRLDEVEKTALADIEARKARINNAKGLSASQKQRQIDLLEEVEIRLAYRMGLKGPEAPGAKQLDLPGQPHIARFTNMVGVSQATLDATYDRIIQLNESPQEFQALMSREFWQDYVTHKYRTQFGAQSLPYQERLAQLRDRVDAGTLSEGNYEARAKDMQAQLAIEEASLMERLSRQEIAEYLMPHGEIQTLAEPSLVLRLSEAEKIEYEGKPYFIASLPDAGDGLHYVLRVQDPKNPFVLVSAGIVAKPDIAGAWKRRGLSGGMKADVPDDEFELASESMQVKPYTRAELDFMRHETHFINLDNRLGTYNRANNGKYPLRDYQGRPIRIRGLESRVTTAEGHRYSSAQIKPYIQFEGYERVAALYDEKLQLRTFTAEDVKVPGERGLIGQSMVVANRRIAKGEILGVYGGTILPRGLVADASSTFGMVVGHTKAPEVEPITLVGDNIISRMNTHFEYDADGKPIRQAEGGYNVEVVPFRAEAVYATSRSGAREAFSLNAAFATEDIPAGVELRWDYQYTDGMIKNQFS